MRTKRVVVGGLFSNENRPKIAASKPRHVMTRADRGWTGPERGPPPEQTGPPPRGAELGNARIALGLLAGGIIHPKACLYRGIPAAARMEGGTGRSIQGPKAELFTASPQKSGGSNHEYNSVNNEISPSSAYSVNSTRLDSTTSSYC